MNTGASDLERLSEVAQNLQHLCLDLRLRVVAGGVVSIA